MHAEQRPCTMAQKIAGGGCAVATNLEHTCSLELYTQVARRSARGAILRCG